MAVTATPWQKCIPRYNYTVIAYIFFKTYCLLAHCINTIFSLITVNTTVMNTTQSVLCYLRAGPIMGHWTKLNCRGVGLRRYFISVNHQVCEVEHEGWLWVTSESGACSVSHSFLSHSPRDYTPAQHEEAVSLKDMFKAHTPAFFSLFHTHSHHTAVNATAYTTSVPYVP